MGKINRVRVVLLISLVLLGSITSFASSATNIVNVKKRFGQEGLIPFYMYMNKPIVGMVFTSTNSDFLLVGVGIDFKIADIGFTVIPSVIFAPKEDFAVSGYYAPCVFVVKQIGNFELNTGQYPLVSSDFSFQSHETRNYILYHKGNVAFGPEVRTMDAQINHIGMRIKYNVSKKTQLEACIGQAPDYKRVELAIQQVF